MDDSRNRESNGEEEKTPEKKAEDNPWSLLASLHGAPANSPDERWGRTRRDWNRYLAAALAKETRGRLIEEKRHPEEE
jgi:hypothetical protein